MCLTRGRIIYNSIRTGKMVERDIQIVEIVASFKFNFITEKALSGGVSIYLELKIFLLFMVGK